MNHPQEAMMPVIDGVLHPTDFTGGSRAAFHHALRLACMAKPLLTLMHVTTEATSEWTDFLGVRETLERWGWLPKDSPPSALRSSHSERVLRQAPVPLLTVHPPPVATSP